MSVEIEEQFGVEYKLKKNEFTRLWEEYTSKV